MSGNTLSIAEAAISALILLSAYYYSYLKNRRRSMMLWTVGWTWYLVRLLLVLFEVNELTGAASLLSGWFLLAGSYAFVGRRARPLIAGLFIVVGVWEVVAGFVGVAFWMHALPTFTLLGGAMIRMGILLHANATPRGFGERVASIGLILWGLHKFNYPFLRGLEWFAPIGFTIGGLLALVVGVGMLMAFLDRTHEQMRLSEDRFRSLVGSMEDIVVTTDPHGRIVDAYGGWFERNRMNRELILSRKLTDLLDHRHDEIVSLEIGEAMRGLVRNRTIDIDLSGVERWFSFTISPLRDGLDRVIGVVIVGRDITDCTESRNALAERLQENETLLQEIHHRVKNNMQIMASLLSLQSGRLKDADDRVLLEESSQRIQTMAHVHEQLYASQSLSHVAMAPYIQELASRLSQTYGCCEHGIEIRAEIDEIELSIERAVPCAQILHELITNALKHAFTDRDCGTVTISMKRSGPTHLALTVHDNGRGMEKSANECGSGDTLGMKLIELLSRQLDGAHTFSNSIGTRFELTFEQERSGG